MSSEQARAQRHRAHPSSRSTLSVWQRFMLEWLAIGCVGVVVVFVVVFCGIGTSFDRLVYDRILTMRSQSLAPEIAVVCIDDDSVAALGRWPWPREVQARLIDAVANQGAAAIVYDVLLTEPAQGDELLSQALRAAPTYLPLFVGPSGRADVFLPVSRFAAAAAGVGHIDVEPDSDGIVRAIALKEHAAGRDWPYLIVPLLDDIRSGKIPLAGGRYRTQPTRSVATGERAADAGAARVLIPFSGRIPNDAQVAARDLLGGRIRAGALRGKVVFVGLTASGLATHLATPITGSFGPTADPLLHADALSALLTGSEIRPVPQQVLFAVSLVPLAALLAGLLFLSPWRALLLTLCLGVVSFLLSAALLDGAFTWLSPVPALVSLFAVYPLWSWRRLEMTMWRLQRELQRLADDADNLPMIPSRPREVRGDALERHIALVEQAADRMKDMQRFIWDCLNSVPEPILIADPQGRICVANKAAHACFARVTDVKPEGRLLTETLGEMTFVKTMAPENMSDAQLRARWPEVLDPTDLDRVWIVKRGIEVRDRAEQDYLLRYARCRNGRGEASGYWVVGLVEVTALHAAEQAREDALRLLSHDMRSPHASVLALIEEEMIVPHSERLRKLFRNIERYTRRALTLADDFVQLTRAESQAYVFEPVNLADVVLDASDEIWPQARAKGILVETHFEGDGHWVHADRSLMTRAFTNLLNNAVKYSPNDTVIRVSVTHVGHDRVQCRIADQGYGMTEDARAHLFERFRRFRAPGQPHSQGAGLGMALVKTVIGRHEGNVDVASELGRGTTVTVSLPRWNGSV